MSIRDNLDISAYLVLGPENTLGRPVGDVVMMKEIFYSFVKVKNSQAVSILLKIFRSLSFGFQF